MPSNPDPANSGRFSRPIDPPDPPSWGGAPDDAPPARLAPAPMPELPRTAEDETPTLSSDEMPSLPPTATEDVVVTDPHPPPRDAPDPKDLARRLAEEAKRRLARAHGATPSTPPDPPSPPPRSATPVPPERIEAGLRTPGPPPERTQAGPLPGTEERPVSTAEPARPQEDPRELARRLADEAKRRMNPGALPARNDDNLPKGASASGPTELRATPGPAPDRSLSERAVTNRALSAADALAAAREAERRGRESRAAPTAPPPTPIPALPRAAAADSVHRGLRPPEAVVARGPSNPAAVVIDLMPGSEVEAPIPVANLDVFRALWRAHRARALHEHDLRLVATASVLLDAVDRVPSGRFVAARVALAGEVWAVFADVDRKAILACLKPPEVYLAGL